MGKNRHSKDRLFITATEWKQEYGGKKTLSNHSYQALPFDHCALTLSPFETPVCNSQVIILTLINSHIYLISSLCYRGYCLI
jgi:peptidyl-prolyl cis-trans isomerase-like protein 2